MKKDPDILTKAISPIVGFSDPFYSRKPLKSILERLKMSIKHF